MINLDEAKKIQKDLQIVAEHLLKQVPIEQYLKPLGDCHRVGSLKTGLMVRPDIDFKIYSETIDAGNVIDVAKTMLHDLPEVAGIKITDFTKDFDSSSTQVGIYFGVTVVFDGVIWKIDAPLRRPNEYQLGEAEIDGWMERMTSGQHDQLLLLKAQLLELGRYGRKGCKSEDVYRAFFKNHVRAPEDISESGH